MKVLRPVLAVSCVLISMRLSLAGDSRPEPLKTILQRPPEDVARTQINLTKAEIRKYQEVASASGDTPQRSNAIYAELNSLFELERLGDISERERRREVALLVKNDVSLSEAKRFEAYAKSTNSDIVASRQLSRRQRLKSFADNAWSLAQDFPSQSASYTSLVSIARDSEPDDAREICGKLISDPRVPREIKERALKMSAWLNCINKTAPRIILADDESLTRPSPLCMYTWSIKDDGSRAMGAALERRIPPSVMLISLCLDPEVEGRPSNPPLATGSVVGAAATMNDELAMFLKDNMIEDAGVIILVGPSGRILSVSTSAKFARKLIR